MRRAIGLLILSLGLAQARAAEPVHTAIDRIIAGKVDTDGIALGRGQRREVRQVCPRFSAGSRIGKAVSQTALAVERGHRQRGLHPRSDLARRRLLGGRDQRTTGPRPALRLEAGRCEAAV